MIKIDKDLEKALSFLTMLWVLTIVFLFYVVGDYFLYLTFLMLPVLLPSILLFLMIIVMIHKQNKVVEKGKTKKSKLVYRVFYSMFILGSFVVAKVFFRIKIERDIGLFVAFLIAILFEVLHKYITLDTLKPLFIKRKKHEKELLR